MPQPARYFVSVVGLMFGVSGCPVTDDYYLLPADGEPNQAAAGKNAQAGSIVGGSSSAGSGTAGEVASGGSAGGAPDLGKAGMPMTGEAGAGGATPEPCIPTTERCNGHDDDCDELIDEFACLSNCSGFVLASNPDHGYMFGNGARKADFDNATQA